nr:XRE family transcriptional regulator [Ruminococcus bromii]
MDIGKMINQRRTELKLTLEQVGQAVGVGKSTVKKWEDGYISNMRRDKIALLAKVLKMNPVSFITGEFKEEEENQAIPLPQTNVFMRPVYDSISAGFGVIAQDVPVDYMPTYITCPSEQDKYIWINVHGDSMSPLIDDGSKILVKKQSSVDSGQIAAVLVDDEEAVVKKVLYNDNTVELHSVNPYYPPRVFKNNDVTRVQILGLVKEVSKSLQ